MKTAISRADPHDWKLLTNIIFLSKQLFSPSYTDFQKFMHHFTISEDEIRTSPFYKLSTNNMVFGFYSIRRFEHQFVKVEHFYVHPEFIGQGVGTKLMQNLLTVHYKKLFLEAEPSSTPFFQKHGFQPVGHIVGIHEQQITLMERDKMGAE